MNIRNKIGNWVVKIGSKLLNQSDIKVSDETLLEKEANPFRDLALLLTEPIRNSASYGRMNNKVANLLRDKGWLVVFQAAHLWCSEGRNIEDFFTSPSNETAKYFDEAIRNMV